MSLVVMMKNEPSPKLTSVKVKIKLSIPGGLAIFVGCWVFVVSAKLIRLDQLSGCLNKGKLILIRATCYE